MDENKLKDIHSSIDTPFCTVLSEKTFKEIEECAKTTVFCAGTPEIARVLGVMHARATRRQLSIEGRVLETYASLSENEVSILGIPCRVSLGVKALAQSIKKGGTLPWSLIEEIALAQKSTCAEKTSLCSFCKAVVKTGQDRNSLCYNRLFDFVGDVNTLVQLKAIFGLVSVQCSDTLIKNILGSLEADVQNRIPNPVWTPGLWTLLGVWIERTGTAHLPARPILQHNPSPSPSPSPSTPIPIPISIPTGTPIPACTRTSLSPLIEQYIWKTSDENSLMGILTVLWALTRHKETWHMQYTAVLALFARHASIRHSAKGILIEYLGMHPSKNNLHIMDLLSAPAHKAARPLLHALKVKRKVLRGLAPLLVSEGVPERIRLGVRIRAWAEKKAPARTEAEACTPKQVSKQVSKHGYNLNNLFEHVAALYTGLWEKDRGALETALKHVRTEDVSLLVNASKELLKLALQSVLLLGVDAPNAKEVLFFALRKDVFPVLTAQILLTHPFPGMDTALKKLPKYSGAGLIRALTARDRGDSGDTGDTGERGDSGDSGDTGDNNERGDSGDTGDNNERGDTGDNNERGDSFSGHALLSEMDASNPAYLPTVYVLGARRLLCREEAKQTLFAALQCYSTDRHLGDVGSHSRLSALCLLSLPFADTKKLWDTFPPSLKPLFPHLETACKLLQRSTSTSTHTSTSTTTTTTRNIPLEKEEKRRLVLHILKLAGDKSKRISSFIFSSLLASLLHLPPVLHLLLSTQQTHLHTHALEDACLLAVARVLEEAEKKRTEKHAEEARWIAEGVLGTAVSSDGGLFKKLEAHVFPLLKRPWLAPASLKCIRDMHSAYLAAGSSYRAHRALEVCSILSAHTPAPAPHK
ncbi:hypothetical protein NECID01_0380 [Nematocida sp. AWRm77]|nr:hypothetical protein NECID01_0380 [Nematocida sp. AWRm77]